MIAYGNFLFRHRNWIFPLFMVALFLSFRPAPPDGYLADMIGVAVVLLGAVIRGAVVGLAYIKRGGLQKKVYAADLVTDGMFSHCRNPLYVGNVLMVAGYLVIHGNPWVYAIGGLYFLISYHAIVAAEEAYLRANFGEAYVAYCRDVPRWWVRLSGFGATFGSMDFNWRRVVVKDYSTLDTAIITTLALLALQSVSHQGFETARGALITLGAILIAVQIAALTIVILKKSGRLKA